MRSKAIYIISMFGVMYYRSRVTKRREAVEESLQCSRAVSQRAEEATQPTVRLQPVPTHAMRSLWSFSNVGISVSPFLLLLFFKITV